MVFENRILNVKLYFFISFLLIFSLEGLTQNELNNKKRIELTTAAPPKSSIVDEEIMLKKTLKNLEIKLNYIKKNTVLYQEAIAEGWIEDIERAIVAHQERLKSLQK